jgi:hypothetical protein
MIAGGRPPVRAIFLYHLQCAILICSTTICFSQTGPSLSMPSVRTLKKIMVGHDSGFEWEQKLGRTTTLSVFAGIGVGFATSEFGVDALNTKIIAGPTSYIAFKKYYNLDQRLKKGKPVANNSGNFFIGHVEVYFPVKNQNYLGLLFSQGWGIQRSISRRINFELQLGITEHIFYDDPARGPYIRIHPITNMISFSYLL